MKTYLIIFLSVFGALNLSAQSDSLGLPGDDFDLCGALQLFKAAKTPDDFEKALNLKDNKINNLDLNADGKVDYLRVMDNSKGDAHAMIIRDEINKGESQDVAVIEIEKKGDKNAQLQIVGDEELYGNNYIIEPKPEKTTNEGKWQGFAPEVIIVNVWYWPCVSYLWYPDYVVWVSPWYWGYYPAWWYPWEPMPYYMYYQNVYYYHDYYYWTDDYRCTQAHAVYQPRRVASTTVHQRNEPAHQRVAAREKAAPRRTPGTQNPVPGRRPAEKNPAQQRETPREAPKENVPPASTPRSTEQPRQQAEPPREQPPKDQPRNQENPPRQKENPTPRPEKQPRVNTPSPRPAPTPKPPRQSPQSRPRPR